ncbi:MAG: group 1 glycosyl transferase [Candidatus Saccharibacteria bacterium]|nr:group 1 glycosyl transferase [Candidatus Saccharibacteria bacterium]
MKSTGAKRTLLIDCQILQTPAFDRGMGKYTISILKTFIEKNKIEKKYDNIQLVLSKNLEISGTRLEYIKNQINVEQVLLDLPVDISHQYKEKHDQSVKKLTLYVESTYKKAEDVDFLIMAPFFVGFASAFPEKCGSKFVIVYDLTPQKIWHKLKIFPDDIYFSHYNLFFEANHLFTISHAVRDEMVLYLGLPESKLSAIDGGPFMQEENKVNGVSETSKKLLDKPFILFPSGSIVHKNNHRAVEGFAKFNRLHDDKYRLLVTSTFSEDDQRNLKQICPAVYFTGNISDEEINYMYTKADAVLFASIAEGLGMPVLEASVSETPVACSNIPVLRELSGEAFYLFDPSDVQDIADKLTKAVARENWVKHLNAIRIVQKKYTWERSATLLFEKMTSASTHSSRPKPSCILVVKVNNLNSPASYLAERALGQLSGQYQVELLLHEKRHISAPLFLSYYNKQAKMNNKNNTTTITISDTRNILKIGRESSRVHVEIRCSKDHNTKYTSRRVTLDKMLELKEWQYKTNAQPWQLAHRLAEDIVSNL